MNGPENTTGDFVRRAVHRLRGRTGIDVAFAGPCPEYEADRLVIRHLSGTSTQVFAGLHVLAGTGVGGMAISTRRPVRVVDYIEASAISHEYDRAVTAEGVRAVFAVPVLAGREVAAVLYGALRHASAFGDGVVTAACDAARDAGREIAVAREVELRLAHAIELPEWATREIREAHADLLTLAEEVADPAIRARLHGMCARLARTTNAAPYGHAPTTAPALTRRETDVLAHVAFGRTNAQTADALAIAPETVKSYLRSAMRKLSAHNRVEAVFTAREAGLLP